MDSEKELLLFLLLYLEVEQEVPRTLKVRGTYAKLNIFKMQYNLLSYYLDQYHIT